MHKQIDIISEKPNETTKVSKVSPCFCGYE